MKKFLINCFLFGVLFLIYDKSYLFIAHFSAESEVDKRLEKLINGEFNKDLYVFGSSRAANNIIAGEIEKITGISSYNLAYQGCDIEFQEFILKTLIHFNKKPKIIIKTLDNPSELTYSSTMSYRLDRLYPLIQYNYITDELVRKKEKNFLLSKVFILHRFYKRNFDISKKYFDDTNRQIECGSVPIHIENKKETWLIDPKSIDYDLSREVNNRVNSFANFQKICLENDIQLIYVYPPKYGVIHSSQFQNRMRLFYEPYPIHEYVFDTLNTAIYQNKDYFFDQVHLNSKGASVFSVELALKLKTILEEE